MNYFPAAAGTLVVIRDHDATHGVTYTPVVGWCHVQGNLAFPILAMAFGGLTHGKAVVSPDGFVTDPTHQQVFENVDEWAAFIDRAKEPKEPSQTEKVIDKALKEDAAPGKPATRAAKAAPTGQIIFGTKTFTTKSFWKVPEMEAIFEVEGNETYPKDPRAEKVKRDDYMALKKEGWTKIDPRSGVLEETEEVETVTEDEDDDDGSDLV